MHKISSAPEIRMLTAADAESYWKLRLEGLSHDPSAFQETVAEHTTKGMAKIRERLIAGDAAFVVGAFSGGMLVGSVGFNREVGEKVQHNGLVWGLYVTPPLRRRGIARQMMSFLIDQTRTIRGIEQLHLRVSESQYAARRLSNR